VEGDYSEEDVINLLVNAKAIESVQSDPSVQDESACEAGETTNIFLDKAKTFQNLPVQLYVCPNWMRR